MTFLNTIENIIPVKDFRQHYYEEYLIIRIIRSLHGFIEGVYNKINIILFSIYLLIIEEFAILKIT